MLTASLRIARHELLVVLRTRRALAVAALYLGLGVLGGGGYVAAVRTIEQKTAQLLTQHGGSPEEAARSMDLAKDQAYQKIAAFFAGSEADAMAASLRDSVILPAFFWCSLAFLPFVILLTSFDQLSPDLLSRSICYSTLRVPRSAIVLGKALAHASIFMVLVALGSVVLVTIAAGALTNVDLVASLPGLLRLWLLLLPFGLCYVAISSFCSSLTRQSFAALMLAIATLVLLRALSWTEYLDAEGSVGMLRHLRWLSPASYHHGLWLAGFTAPVMSAAAYLLFAALFLTASMATLRGRDL